MAPESASLLKAGLVLLVAGECVVALGLFFGIGNHM